MINGLVAHVELEHEIMKWTSSITNSLALICNTVQKRCNVNESDPRSNVHYLGSSEIRPEKNSGLYGI